MEKDFEAWHIVKKNVHEAFMARPAGYKERDVWWVCLGHNIGFEEDGKGQNFSRPVLVIKGFNKQMFWAYHSRLRIKRGYIIINLS